VTSNHYILVGRKPFPEPDIYKRAEWFETANRVVRRTIIVAPSVTVSTVFLGLDHQFGGGPPLLFETLIFGGDHDGDTWRYSVWNEAMRGHERIVAEFHQLREGR